MFSNTQIAAILKALPDPVFILTRSGRYAAIFGGSDLRYYHDSSALVGKLIRDVINEEKTSWFIEEIEKALTSRKLHVVDYCLSGKDVKGLQDEGPQHTIWFEGRVQALDFQVQGEDAVLWVASNITDHYELETKLRIQSETDPLTGLYNRRKLMEALSGSYDVFVRYATPTTVLIFDIDEFKRFNDEHGHLQGDEAIKATADIFKSELRNTDALARFGGDEFVLMMPHTNCEQAAPIVERLRDRVARELCRSAELGRGVTISGGLGEFLPTDSTCEGILKRADAALYQAKRDGRNRIVG